MTIEDELKKLAKLPGMLVDVKFLKLLIHIFFKLIFILLFMFSYRNLSENRRCANCEAENK
jgi:hypothetical protein